MIQATNHWQAAGMLAGGLGLFLYGVGVLADALRQSADTALRRALSRGTRSPLHGLLLGTFVTGGLQSSSASTVLMVGLCNAGLLSLRQSVGLVLGAGIGGTVTAQLLTVNWLAALAPWCVCAGAFLTLFTRRHAARLAGMALLGFGLVFVGFDLMRFGVEPWKPAIQEWFQALARPGAAYLLASLGIGIAATIVVQSAAVTTGMAIALAAGGAITSMPSALALMIGCNIGTTITTVLAAAGGTGAARQLAAVHVMFRILGGVVSLLAIPLYAWLLDGAMPMDRALANFHTLHNTVNALLFLPLSGLLAWLALRLVPPRDDFSPAPLFLDFGRRDTPDERCRQAHREIMRLADLTRSMTSDAIAGMAERRERLFETVLAREKQVDALHATIVQFLLAADDEESQSDRTLAPACLLQLAHNLERIGDHAENLVELAGFYQPPKQPMHPELHAHLLEAGRMVEAMFAAAAPALSGSDPNTVNRLSHRREALNGFIAEKTDRARDMVRSGACRPIDAALFEDFLANLQSSASHLLRASKAMLGD
jgi:phosphate:Na+ symporter